MKKLLLAIVIMMLGFQGMKAEDEVTVTLNFIGHDMGENVYEKVHIFTEAFSGKFIDKVKVDSDHFTFACVPSVGLIFEPYDDYKIWDLTTNIEDPEVVNIQGGKYNRSITLLPGVPEQVEINIEIAPEDYTGIIQIEDEKVSPKVYNLQGVKVAESKEDLSNLSKGVYIVNGKKILVK